MRVVSSMSQPEAKIIWNSDQQFGVAKFRELRLLFFRSVFGASIKSIELNWIKTLTLDLRTRRRMAISVRVSKTHVVCTSKTSGLSHAHLQLEPSIGWQISDAEVVALLIGLS